MSCSTGSYIATEKWSHGFPLFFLVWHVVWEVRVTGCMIRSLWWVNVLESLPFFFLKYENGSSNGISTCPECLSSTCMVASFWYGIGYVTTYQFLHDIRCAIQAFARLWSLCSSITQSRSPPEDKSLVWYHLLWPTPCRPNNMKEVDLLKWSKAQAQLTWYSSCLCYIHTL